MVRHRPNWDISKLDVPVTSSFLLPDSRCCHIGLSIHKVGNWFHYSKFYNLQTFYWTYSSILNCTRKFLGSHYDRESMEIVVLFKAQSKFSHTDEVKNNSHSPAQSRGQSGFSNQEN